MTEKPLISFDDLENDEMIITDVSISKNEEGGLEATYTVQPKNPIPYIHATIVIQGESSLIRKAIYHRFEELQKELGLIEDYVDSKISEKTKGKQTIYQITIVTEEEE